MRKVPPIILASAVLFSLYEWAVFGSTFWRPGLIGLDFDAPGADWMVPYTAARAFFDGDLGWIFEGHRFTARLNAAFSWWLPHPLAFRPWVYPPSYLLIVLPFGALPFAVSYAVFELGSAAMLVLMICIGADQRDARGLVAAAALLCPAAAINALGQNGFLTSALLVGGIRFLRPRPVLAGGVLGVLTIKPQFWALVPVALVAAREWRVLIASLASAGALAVVSACVFGIGAWWQWFSTTTASMSSNGLWTGYARLWGDSVYACLTAAGASPIVANTGQAAAILLAAGTVVAAFRWPLPSDQKLAVLLAAVLLAAPHSSIYDKVMLAVAAALWISAKDAAPISKWILPLGLWLTPLFNPPLLLSIGRVTPALILAFIAVVLGEAVPSRRVIESIGSIRSGAMRTLSYMPSYSARRLLGGNLTPGSRKTLK